MKKVLFFVLAVAALTSCSTLRKSTARTMEVESGLKSNTEADLVVSDQRITYEYTPNRQERKRGVNFVVTNAVAKALEANGNADVLVEKQYDITYKTRFIFGKKITKVKVSGHPGTYKNFRTPKPKPVVVQSGCCHSK